MKLAIVYDRATKYGGAERVLTTLHAIWPQAPLYTAFHYRKGAAWASDIKVIPSFLQKIPLANRNHELFPWATPIAFESFSFDGFDVVLSVTSAEAKNIVTTSNTLHICYCLTPTRYLWSHTSDYQNSIRKYFTSEFFLPIFTMFIPYLQKWDYFASKRPDVYIPISKRVKERIRNFYHIEPEHVIYPPLDLQKFYPKKSKQRENDYYLLVSRPVYYKRLDLVILAFNKLGLPLKIITGVKIAKWMRELAANNIELISRHLTDEELLRYYQNCRAFIFAGDEDFGLVAAEAQACGKPVIAYRQSGISEIVVHNKTGILYNSQTTDELITAIHTFQKRKFSASICRDSIKKFSTKLFKKRMKKTVESLYLKYKTL